MPRNNGKYVLSNEKLQLQIYGRYMIDIDIKIQYTNELDFTYFLFV